MTFRRPVLQSSVDVENIACVCVCTKYVLFFHCRFCEKILRSSHIKQIGI